MADKVEPKAEKTEQEKMQEFVKAYEALCETHGYTINVLPVWKPRDDGTFSMILQSSVGRLETNK